MKTALSAVVAICCMMCEVLSAFEVEPIIIPVNREVTITVHANEDAEKKAIAELPLHYLSDLGCWTDGEFHGDNWNEWQPIDVTRSDGALMFTLKVKEEGLHTLRFGPPYEKGALQFLLYSLEDDLFAMRPYKGDIHQHSVRCGHAKLEPAVIPAYNRKMGFDFMALTEHRQVAPSFEVIESVQKSTCGLTVFVGEEFHTPSDMLHSVALGHREAISTYPKDHPEEFKRRFEAELQKSIYDHYGLNYQEKRQAAMSTVLYQVARENGAKLVIYSHPYCGSQPRNCENPPRHYRRFMLENADYDALEMPNTDSGTFDSKYTAGIDVIMMMNALWNETCHKRNQLIPVVGASDCHDQRDSWFEWTAVTVFFAPKCTFDDFVEAVKSRRSISSRKPRTPNYIAFGPSRLIKFQQFLDRCYWPGHDQLCRQQSELMLKLDEGDDSVIPEIGKLAAEIDAYRERCFAKTN